MISKILRKLDVKSSETFTVLWSFLLAFLIGSAQCYMSAVPMSLFLTKFSSASLPQVYLIVAGVAIGLGGVYTFFETRLAFNRLMFGLILVIACVTTFLWMLITGVNSKWIVALLTVWAIVAYDLLDFGMWSVFSSIYNLQQGKRLFGFIGASQSIGGISAGFLLPVLLIFISTQLVILYMGILIFLSLCILVKLLKSNSTAGEEEEERIENTSDLKVSTLFKNRYVLKLLTLTVITVFVMYIVDIVFNTAAEARYPNEEALAGFLGIFFGLVDCLDLVMSTVVFGLLLKRIGTVLSLCLLPALGVITGVVLLTSHMIPWFFFLVFWMVVLLKLFEEAIRASVSDMCQLLLLQPLSPRLRAFTLSKNDTLIVPLATGAISLLLMLVSNTVGIVIPGFIMVTIGLFVIALMVIFSLRSEYVRALTKAVANRFTMGMGFQPADKESLLFFQNALENPHPDQVIYALTNIERLDKTEFFKVIKRISHFSHPAVRIFMLQKIKEYEESGFYAEVLTLLETDPDDSVKAQAIHTIASLNFEQAEAKIQSFSQCSPRSHLYSASYIARLKYTRDEGERAQILAHLKQQLLSEDTHTRRTALSILGAANAPEANQWLSPMMSDPDRKVQRAAYAAIIRTDQVQYLNEVLKNINMLQLIGTVKKHLIVMREAIVPLIEAHFDEYKQPAQLKLVYLIPELSNDAAYRFLEHIALESKGRLRQTALRALVKIEGIKGDVFANKLSPYLQREAQFLRKQLDMSKAIPIEEQTELLRSVMKRKNALSVERLLIITEFMYYNQPITKIRNTLEVGNEDEISYAMELLERVLTTEHRKLILPVLTEQFLTEVESDITRDPNAFEEVLRQSLQLTDEDNLTVVCCLAALYILKNRDTTGFGNELTALNASTHPLIKETVEWLRHE